MTDPQIGHCKNAKLIGKGSGSIKSGASAEEDEEDGVREAELDKTKAMASLMNIKGISTNEVEILYVADDDDALDSNSEPLFQVPSASKSLSPSALSASVSESESGKVRCSKESTPKLASLSSMDKEVMKDNSKDDEKPQGKCMGCPPGSKNKQMLKKELASIQRAASKGIESSTASNT